MGLFDKFEVKFSDVAAEALGGIGKEFKAEDRRMSKLLAKTFFDMTAEGKAAKLRFEEETKRIKSNFQKLLPYTGGVSGFQDPDSVKFLASLTADQLDNYITQFETLQRSTPNRQISAYEGFGIKEPGWVDDVFTHQTGFFDFSPEWVDLALADIQGKPDKTPLPDEPEAEKKFTDDFRFMLGTKLKMLGGDVPTVYAEAARQTEAVLGYTAEDYLYPVGAGVSPVHVAGRSPLPSEQLLADQITSERATLQYSEQYNNTPIGEAAGFRQQRGRFDENGQWVFDQNGPSVNLRHAGLGIVPATMLMREYKKMQDEASKLELRTPRPPVKAWTIYVRNANKNAMKVLESIFDVAWEHDELTGQFYFTTPTGHRTLVAEDIMNTLLPWIESRQMEHYNTTALTSHVNRFMLKEFALHSLLKEVLSEGSPWWTNRSRSEDDDEGEGGDPTIEKFIAEFRPPGAVSNNILIDQILGGTDKPWYSEGVKISSVAYDLLAEWVEDPEIYGKNLPRSGTLKDLLSSERLLEIHTQHLINNPSLVPLDSYQGIPAYFGNLPEDTKRQISIGVHSSVREKLSNPNNREILANMSPEQLQTLFGGIVREEFERQFAALGITPAAANEVNPGVAVGGLVPDAVGPTLPDNFTSEQWINFVSLLKNINDSFAGIVEKGSIDRGEFLDWYKLNVEDTLSAPGREEELNRLPRGSEVLNFLAARRAGTVPEDFDPTRWNEIIKGNEEITTNFRLEMQMFYDYKYGVTPEVAPGPHINIPLVPLSIDREEVEETMNWLADTAKKLDPRTSWTVGTITTAATWLHDFAFGDPKEDELTYVTVANKALMTQIDSLREKYSDGVIAEEEVLDDLQSILLDVNSPNANVIRNAYFAVAPRKDKSGTSFIQNHLRTFYYAEILNPDKLHPLQLPYVTPKT